MLLNGLFQSGDTVQVVRHHKLVEAGWYELFSGLDGEGYFGVVAEDQTTYTKNGREFLSKNVSVKFPKEIAEKVGFAEVWLPYGCLVCKKSIDGKVMEKVKSISGMRLTEGYQESVKY